MAGNMIGSFLVGYFSDKLGRKIVLMASIVLSSGASLMGAFMPDYYSYLFSRLAADKTRNRK